MYLSMFLLTNYRTTYTRSIAHSLFMTTTEKVTFKPDPNNPNETIANKEVWVESNFIGRMYVLN